MTLLTKIINTVTKKEDAYAFPSEAHESAFKKCLSKVKTKASIELHGTYRILRIRPVNVGDFRKAIHDNGLGSCGIALISLNWLEQHPAESLRFISSK